MVLNFTKNLQQTLQEIELIHYHQFIIHDKEEIRVDHDAILSRYGDAKWGIIDFLNQNYSTILKDKFDLYNWINGNMDDEVSYFINEAGSNSLNHSDYKAPFKFHLWMGKKGFILGVEQKGQGFNAHFIDKEKIKTNQGNAFNFFRKCRSTIFFDNSENVNIVFMATHF